MALPELERERAVRVATEGMGLPALAVMLLAAAGAAVGMAFLEAATPQGVLGHLLTPDATARALTGGFWSLVGLTCALLAYSLSVRRTAGGVVRRLLKELEAYESGAA